MGQLGKSEIQSCGISGQPLLCTAPWGHTDYLRDDDDDVGNDDGDDDGDNYYCDDNGDNYYCDDDVGNDDGEDDGEAGEDYSG